MLRAWVIEVRRRDAAGLRAFGFEEAADRLDREIDHEEALVANRAIDTARRFEAQMKAIASIANTPAFKVDDFERAIKAAATGPKGGYVWGGGGLKVPLAPGEVVVSPERAEELGLTADARRMRRERGDAQADA
jgi:hypothetical protein